MTLYLSPRLVTVLAVLALTLSMVITAPAAPTTPIVSKDGETFTLDDVSLYYLRNLGKDGLLDFLQTMVVYQEGKKIGLTTTAAEKSDFIEKKMGRDVYDGFSQLFNKAEVDQLVDYTQVEAKYYKYLRDKIKKDKNYTVSEKEARDYFTSHIEDFHLPEGAYLSIISVDSQAKADAVLKRLSAGEDFRKIAGEVNMDPKMRAMRGELGVYRKGDGLPKELETAALALKKGEYTKKAIKGTNYHLLFCHEKYAEVTPKFDDVKEQLMSDMLESKVDPDFQDQLDKLMAREMPRFTIQADLFKPDANPTDSVSKTKPSSQPSRPGTSKPGKP
jgi:parvulin-like peptidyl-prolyl isomerase